jgi:amidase
MPPSATHFGPDGRYAAAKHYLSKENNTHSFSSSHAAAITIKPGELIQVQTFDCFKGRVDGLTPAEAALVDLKDEECNPVTGPIFVEGAEPDDTLSVTIHHIQPGSRGCARTWSGVGQLHEQCPRPHATFFSIADGVVTMSSRVSFPAKPMLGVIGVAPAGKDAILTMPAGPHGGNLDNEANGIGATIHLKVHHPGALLSVGDMHASQGDGEICGTGVEVGGDVLLSVALKKMQATTYPVTELGDAWITHGVAEEDLNAACKIACEEAAGLLVRQWSFTPEEAFVFLSVQGKLGICQNVHPSKGSVIAKMTVPKLTSCPSPFNAALAPGRSEKDCLLYEALGHFVPGDLSDFCFDPTTGGVNNVVYYVFEREKSVGAPRLVLRGVLRVYVRACFGDA